MGDGKDGGHQLRAWFGISNPKEMKLLMVSYLIFWSNWKDRNRTAFERIESRDNSIVEGWARLLYLWQTYL